jgi:hypothetical protein
MFIEALVDQEARAVFSFAFGKGAPGSHFLKLTIQFLLNLVMPIQELLDHRGISTL